MQKTFFWLCFVCCSLVLNAQEAWVLKKNEKGYFGRPVLHHRCSAVTAACLMIKKSTYFAVGGMDEQIAVAFNDVDFCLRLGDAGYHCVYTPSAEHALRNG